jgi:hypothetical protein
LWRRAALALGEEILDCLKEALAEGTLPPAQICELSRWTTQIAAWRRLDGAALVTEYLCWARQQPRLTDGLIYAAKLREEVERRALCAYLSRIGAEAEV